jgi:ribosomal protein L31E
MKTGYGECSLESFGKVICGDSITKFPFAKEFQYGEYRYIELHALQQYNDYNLDDKCYPINIVPDISYSGTSYTHYCILDKINPNLLNKSFMSRFTILEKANELWFIPIVIYCVFLVGVAIYNKIHKKIQRLNIDYITESNGKPKYYNFNESLMNQHFSIEMERIQPKLQPFGDSKKTPLITYKDYKDYNYWKRKYSSVIKSIKKVYKKDFIELSPINITPSVQNKMFKRSARKLKSNYLKFYNPKEFESKKTELNKITPHIQSTILPPLDEIYSLSEIELKPTHTISTRVLHNYTSSSSSSSSDNEGGLSEFVNKLLFFF